MSVPQLEVAKPVGCYSLMIWFCFLPQNQAFSALNSFADVCNTAAMKISTAKIEVLHLSKNPDQCVVQVNGATLKQVEKFKCLGLAFTSDGRQDKGLDTRIDKARTVMRALHYSVVVKRELSKKRQSSQFSKQFLSPFSLMVMNHG